jgi:hypothetical protein
MQKHRWCQQLAHHLYYEQEIRPWVEKLKQIKEQIYFVFILTITMAGVFIVGAGPVESIPISVLKAGSYATMDSHSFKGFALLLMYINTY